MTSGNTSSSTPASTLGERIRQIRNRVPRHEFARTLRIGTSTLQRYESGERRPDTEVVQRLCENYDINPTWLILGLGPMQLAEGMRDANREQGRAEGLDLREASQRILQFADELDYEPSMRWSTLIQELMVVHDLSPDGARRLIETLASLDSPPSADA